MQNFNAIGDFLSNLFSTKSYEISEQYPSLGQLLHELTFHVKSQQDRIEKLEEENVETTNTLYELMHTIDALDARIDIVAAHNETQKEEFNK
jgi:septal ring factor EnvC (AmiA/AmiB activator)